jgi:hypothetical protein
VNKVAGIIDGSNYIREALCARNKYGRTRSVSKNAIMANRTV